MFLKTTVTKIRVLTSSLENIVLVLVALATFMGVVAVSRQIQSSHIRNLISRQGPAPAAVAPKAAQ